MSSAPSTPNPPNNNPVGGPFKVWPIVPQDLDLLVSGFMIYMRSLPTSPLMEMIESFSNEHGGNGYLRDMFATYLDDHVSKLKEYEFPHSHGYKVINAENTICGFAFLTQGPFGVDKPYNQSQVPTGQALGHYTSFIVDLFGRKKVPANTWYIPWIATWHPDLAFRKQIFKTLTLDFMGTWRMEAYFVFVKQPGDEACFDLMLHHQQSTYTFRNIEDESWNGLEFLISRMKAK